MDNAVDISRGNLKVHLYRQSGIAFLISIAFHLVFLIILAIFLNKGKTVQVSSFVELDLVTVENPEPKRRFRRMSEVIPLYDMVNVDDISKEHHFKPELSTLKVNPQLAMLDRKDYSLPSTAVRELQEISSVNLSKSTSASARVGRRSTSEKFITRRPVSVISIEGL